jgi:protein import protein ZIM17
MFTCNVCGTKAIRSFTKNAYHHGVVMVRCEGCENVHLVADNLGWFEDEAKNLDDFSKEEVKKVQDPVAVAKFLKTALTTDTPG